MAKEFDIKFEDIFVDALNEWPSPLPKKKKRNAIKIKSNKKSN